MRALLVIFIALAASAALGLGVSWYLRPEPMNVTGPGFDPAFVAPEDSAEPGTQTQAAQARPAEPSAHELLVRRNNKALKALQAGDLDTALADLRICHEAEPDNVVFRRNLVETMARQARGLWSQSDRQEGIWKLEDAVELSQPLPPADARHDLAGLLAKWKREFEVEGDFWQDMSAHFELSYDASHQDLLHGYQDVIDRAEAAYADLRDFFGFDPVFDRERRIRITLYRRDKFQTVTGLSSWAGGAFDGSVRLPVADLKAELHSMDMLLRHELTHAFIAAAPTKGPVPGWLNEGLAQYLSGEGEIVKRRAKEVLQSGPVDLDTLTGTFSGMSDRGAVARAYTQSLIAVDAIATRYGERMLADLLDDLTHDDEGEASSPQAKLTAAFAHRTGWTLSAMVKEAVGQL